MKYILLLMSLAYYTASAQQRERTLSITCYVNPELYMQGGVIAHISDQAGNISCNGNYVSISNKSTNPFYYERNARWIVVKPQEKTIIFMPEAGAGSKAASIVKLKVRYMPDISGSVTSKIRTIDEMNAQSDRSKAGEQVLKQAVKPASPAARSVKPLNSDASRKSSGTDKAGVEKKAVQRTAAMKAKPETHSKPAAPQKKTNPAKTRPSTASRYSKPKSTKKQEPKKTAPSYTNALGLRLYFGKGLNGLGPNFKHQFNGREALDAAIVFYEGDRVGLVAQFEQNFPVKSDPGLNLYLGVGPQILLGGENTVFALVPAGGVEYRIPDTPLNFSLDWRPNFYLSEEATVNAGRFGFSLRFAF